MTLLDSQDNDTNLSINFKPAFGVELWQQPQSYTPLILLGVALYYMTAMTQGDPRLNVIVNFLKIVWKSLSLEGRQKEKVLASYNIATSMMRPHNI